MCESKIKMRHKQTIGKSSNLWVLQSIQNQKEFCPKQCNTSGKEWLEDEHQPSVMFGLRKSELESFSELELLKGYGIEQFWFRVRCIPLSGYCSHLIMEVLLWKDMT